MTSKKLRAAQRFLRINLAHVGRTNHNQTISSIEGEEYVS